MKNNIFTNSQYKKRENSIRENSIMKALLEWILTIAATVLISLFILGNVFTLTGIDGISMEPTFFHKDRVINYKLGYIFSRPKPGDIVIVNKLDNNNGIISNILEQGEDIVNNFKNKINNEVEIKYIIKRIIAGPGDTIDIREGRVYINDIEIEEKYKKGKTFDRSNSPYPLLVPEGKYFILGDNRDNSLDSRGLGLIDRGQIKGKVVIRLWPFYRFGKVD